MAACFQHGRYWSFLCFFLDSSKTVEYIVMEFSVFVCTTKEIILSHFQKFVFTHKRVIQNFQYFTSLAYMSKMAKSILTKLVAVLSTQEALIHSKFQKNSFTHKCVSVIFGTISPIFSHKIVQNRPLLRKYIFNFASSFD